MATMKKLNMLAKDESVKRNEKSPLEKTQKIVTNS
jgi:hypothetical protein